MDLGRVGIWTPNLDFVPFAQVRDHVAEIEAMGWGALWVPETLGRDAMVNAALLLSASERMVIATGIASIWARGAPAANQSQRTLTEAFGDRFMLGLGASHAVIVEGAHHTPYAKPYSAMVDYLDGMDQAVFLAKSSPIEPTRALAALGPKMLRLAATRTAGAHPYFVPAEHVAEARLVLDEAAAGQVGRPRPLLMPEIPVVLETDPSRAREIARSHTKRYLALPNYTNNLRRFGFDDADLAGTGSDRVTDAVVAWGSVEQIAARVAEFHDAGADHVCIQVVAEDLSYVPLAEWHELAAALL